MRLECAFYHFGIPVTVIQGSVGGGGGLTSAQIKDSVGAHKPIACEIKNGLGEHAKVIYGYLSQEDRVLVGDPANANSYDNPRRSDLNLSLKYGYILT
jgi:hypothetical protein